jgi:hypothetical protein
MSGRLKMHLRCNSELSKRKIDNELFIYDRNKALIHTFNRTGMVLWEAIEAELTFEGAVDRLTSLFDVTIEQATIDTRDFIERLRMSGLIE